MSQRDEFYSCHSDENPPDFDKNLSQLEQQTLEERVFHFLNTSDPPPKLTLDDVIFPNTPRRRYSDITPQLLRHAQAVLKHISIKSQLPRQNSNIFETVPMSSPIYPVLSRPKKTKKEKPGIRKYHPLNVLLNSGPDWSHILSPDACAIVAESRLSSNYATHSLVGSLRHTADTTATAEVRISCLIFTLSVCASLLLLVAFLYCIF